MSAAINAAEASHIEFKTLLDALGKKEERGSDGRERGRGAGSEEERGSDGRERMRQSTNHWVSQIWM